MCWPTTSPRPTLLESKGFGASCWFSWQDWCWPRCWSSASGVSTCPGLAAPVCRLPFHRNPQPRSPSRPTQKAGRWKLHLGQRCHFDDVVSAGGEVGGAPSILRGWVLRIRRARRRSGNSGLFSKGAEVTGGALDPHCGPGSLLGTGSKAMVPFVPSRTHMPSPVKHSDQSWGQEEASRRILDSRQSARRPFQIRSSCGDSDHRRGRRV